MPPRLMAIALVLGIVVTACGDDSTTDVADSEPETVTDPEPTTEPAPSTTSTDPAPADEETSSESDPADGAEPEPEPEPALTLTFDRLPELGPGAVYEGWLIIDSAPFSTGVVGAEATALPTGWEGATAFVLTIEPADDPDPAPSDTHLLAGDIVDGRADLTTDHPAALGTDFADAAGGYILATPTDGTGPAENERSGIWWTDIPRAQSLFLPTLTAGWVYESWAVIDGVPVTGGTFTDPFAADDAAPFSGPEPGPPLVGEDYLVNAPDGLTFPRDLRSQVAVISVEPVPDDSPAPFAIKPLIGGIPADAEDHVVYDQLNAAADSLPTGLAVVG